MRRKSGSAEKFIIIINNLFLANAFSVQSRQMRLRRPLRRTGTKESCAEGDCGACAVVVGRLGSDGALRYEVVNACIRFLATLDGRQRLTVENLRGPDGAPRPAQQAMIEGAC